MATPATLNNLNISGRYVMNHSLSDKRVDSILSMQGVGWIKRKAISVATVTLSINHHKNEEGVEVINIDQTITGGIPASSELRVLSWTERETEDATFGHIITKSKRAKPEDVEIDFLKKGWTADTLENGIILSYTESNTPKSGNTWIAFQAWGIEEINGERRYTRHIKFTGPKNEDIEAVLVYDYVGPLAA